MIPLAMPATLASIRSLWTPAQIATVLWLDAADSSTITESGGALSAWADKSGNGRDATQGTTSDQPGLQESALNNLPVVTFDGVQQTLVGNFSIDETLLASTVFAVIHIASDQGQMGRIAAFLTDLSPLYHIMLVTSNNGGFGVARDRKTVGFMGSGFFGAWCQVAASHDPPLDNGGDIYVNGAEAVFDSSSGMYAAEGGLSDHQYALGSRVGSSYCDVDIAEVLLVPDVTIEMRQKIEGYLAHKWGLTANLPADHPYKSAAPTV